MLKRYLTPPSLCPSIPPSFPPCFPIQRCLTLTLQSLPCFFQHSFYHTSSLPPSPSSVLGTFLPIHLRKNTPFLSISFLLHSFPTTASLARSLQHFLRQYIYGWMLLLSVSLSFPFSPSPSPPLPLSSLIICVRSSLLEMPTASFETREAKTCFLLTSLKHK